MYGINRKIINNYKDFLYVPFGAGELIEPAVAGEDDDGDLDVAEDGELQGLLHQTVPPLRERHVASVPVLDSLDHHLFSPHRHQNPSFSSSLRL